jgi:PhzF family phenazine biosynthesis protein
MNPTSSPPSATVVVAGDQTGGRYAVLEVTVPRGAGLPHHVHRHEDVYVVVVDGSLSLLEDGRSRAIGPGELTRLRPHVPWELRAARDARLLVALVPAGADRIAGLLSAATDDDDRLALLAAAGIDLVPPGLRPVAPAPQRSATSEVLRYAAFTTDPRGGNPAGVVLDAAGLDDAAMQRIATAVGYSETAFVTGQDDARGTSLDVRYFSPVAEVPFCGHATIATAVAHAELHGPEPLTLRTRAGVIDVDVVASPDGPAATLTSVPPTTEHFGAADLDETLAALGWRLGDLDADFPVRVAYAGARHLVLAARTPERLARLDYAFDRLRDLMLRTDLTTLQLIHRVDRDVFHVRNPFPVGGVVEDPATGAAAAALGGYLREHGLVDTPTELEIHQGAEIGRPSLLRVGVPRSGGIRVTGTAVRMTDGG